MKQTPTTTTTHADRVAGWIVIALFLAAVIGMVLASCLRNISVSSQAQLLSIASGCVGALASAFTIRRPVPPADASMQVSIPSSDGSAPTTVTSTTGLTGNGQAPQVSSPLSLPTNKP